MRHNSRKVENYFHGWAQKGRNGQYETQHVRYTILLTKKSIWLKRDGFYWYTKIKKGKVVQKMLKIRQQSNVWMLWIIVNKPRHCATERHRIVNKEHMFISRQQHNQDNIIYGSREIHMLKSTVTLNKLID